MSYASDSPLARFIASRNTLDLPVEHLIDWATTCNDEGMRLYAKYLLDKKALHDAESERLSGETTYSAKLY